MPQILVSVLSMLPTRVFVAFGEGNVWLLAFHIIRQRLKDKGTSTVLPYQVNKEFC